MSTPVIKVAFCVLKETLSIQRITTKSLNISSIGNVKKIMKPDLKLIKTKVNCKISKHISHSKTVCRLLHGNHLAGERWKYIVRVGVFQIYLSDCNRKILIYHQKRKDLICWFRENKESFDKGFMIITLDSLMMEI